MEEKQHLAEKKRKANEKGWRFSKIENFLKERQEIYNANQRELNSVKLELVKSDNQFLYDYFFFIFMETVICARANWYD